MMLWIVVLLFCFAVDCDAYKVKDIYDSLGDGDKNHFYRFYLAKGYLDSEPTDAGFYPSVIFPYDLPIPADIAETFKAIKIEPEDFPVRFFNNFRLKHNLTAFETFLVARGRCDCYPKDKYLCMPDGTCVDLGDNGSICCT